MRGGSLWGKLVDYLRVWRVSWLKGTDRSEAKSVARWLGVARRDDLTDEEVVAARRESARATAERHYAKKKTDLEWAAKRRAYYRERYRLGKGKK